MDDATDFVLRSSDSIDFYTNRAVLCAASPVFRDMFSFPPSGETLTPKNSVNGKPFVQLPERSGIIEALIAMSSLQTFNTLSPTHFRDLVDLHVAVDKYQLDKGKLMFKEALRRFISSDPYPVFAIACLWELEDIAKEAARETLKHRVFPFEMYEKVPEMHSIPAIQLFMLYDFRRQVISHIRRLLHATTDGSFQDIAAGAMLMDDAEVEFIWTTGEGHVDGCGLHYEYITDGFPGGPLVAADWAIMHMERVASVLTEDMRQDPVEVVVSSVKSLDSAALQRLARCRLCIEKGPADLEHLASTLRYMIPMVIDRVRQHDRHEQYARVCDAHELTRIYLRVGPVPISVLLQAETLLFEAFMM